MSLDPEARTAKIQGGEEVAFGKALLGTGAMVNILRVEGAENEGIHYLRAFGNADAIRADAEAAEHVVLIGGSYIGCEVAASLTARGTKCTIVAMEDVALSRTFGEDAGRWFQEQLEAHGVDLPRRRDAERLRGRRPGAARCVTESGLAIECDTVVVGAGVRPDAMLAQRAGIEVGDGGSSATRSCRPRSPGIYAAGDCCSYESVVHGRRIHVEHWDVAMQQGMPRRRQHARRRRATTTSSPTSSATSPTGPASSTSARPTSGTEEVWRGDRDERRVLGLVPAGRPRRRLPQRRPLRGPGRGAADARRRRRRLRRGRCARDASRSQRRYPESAVAAWCNGSTPRSGRGSRGSSPWAAASQPLQRRGVHSLC